MAKAKDAETQRQRQLEYQCFDLVKVKLAKDGPIIEHHETGLDAGTTIKEGEVQPHPDLITALDKLKTYAAQRLGILEGWDFAREHTKSDLDILKLAVDGHMEAQFRYNVNGITIVGDGDKRGVMITGSLNLPKGGSIGMAISKITFGSEKLGYENEVEEICEEIRKECYAYRFQAKKLQLDIETEIEKEENPDLFIIPNSELN